MTQCASSHEATLIEDIKRAADAALVECRRVLEGWNANADKLVKDVTSFWRFESPCELESGDVGEHDA